MKSTPILMKPEMIRAYMAGRKTNTRRVIKNVPPGTDYYHPGWNQNGDRVFTPYRRTNDLERPESMGKSVKCPYGQPGDELAFKETYRVSDCFDNWKPSEVRIGAPVEYLADGLNLLGRFAGKTRPSIFMCSWMIRHRPKITDIRVERIQNISEEDAIKEGIQMTDELWPREVFEELWDSINGKKTGCTWADNPFSWVIEFERYI